MKSIHLILCTCAATLLSGCATQHWESTLKSSLPELGHRNWIVVADSAYPYQSAEGIETIYTAADHFSVLETVLTEVGGAAHVNPVIMVDAELEHVSETDAPGIKAFRESLAATLGEREIQTLPHMDIISKLDTDSKLFKVLLLKTDLTLPYTSVFIQLDCGYWNDEKEDRMRQSIGTRK